MRLRLSRLQKIIAEEITRAIKERDDKGTVTHYAWTYGEGVGGDEIITKEEIEDENATITLYGDGRVEVNKEDAGSAELEWEEFLAIPDASWDDSLKEIDTHPGSVAFSKDIHQKIIDAAKKAKGGDDEEYTIRGTLGDMTLHVEGDNVVLRSDEYEIDIPVTDFKTFAAKL